MNDDNDSGFEVIRPKGRGKREPFPYCKWAAQDWEAHHLVGTPAHRKQSETLLKIMQNDPAWYKVKTPKLDKRTISLNNKARGKKNPRSSK